VLEKRETRARTVKAVSLVCFVYPVQLEKPDKRDQPDRPDQPDKLGASACSFARIDAHRQPAATAARRPLRATCVPSGLLATLPASPIVTADISTEFTREVAGNL
jgi:hypothetical protein